MRFLLTKELGRLAKWLRILGFDARYFKEDNAGTLVILALKESRTVVTRNLRLPKVPGVRTAVIRAQKIREQIVELKKQMELPIEPQRMFSRCIICNTVLMELPKEEAQGKVPLYVFETQERFMRCPQCARVYWQGTHWGNAQKILQEVGL